MGTQPEASLFEAARRAFPLLDLVESEGFLVGGAIRDLILLREPRDADIAIRGAARAAAQFASRAGGRLVHLGAEPFDVLRVAAHGVVYDFAEIAGSSIEDDLARRDFTIGAVAMSLSPPHAVVDPFGGGRDLEGSTLRMVSESNFSDDPLRVLRGARLVAELALEIDSATLEAMRRHSPAVAGVAPERLGVEWLALLSASGEPGLRAALAIVRELGIDTLLAGGAISDAGAAAMLRVRGADAVTRLAALALFADETLLSTMSMRLGVGASRDEAMRRASRLARHLSIGKEPRQVDPVELYDAGENAVRRALSLLRATGHAGYADEVASFVACDGAAIFGARPLLDGHAIGAATGIAPGPRIGEIRRALLVAQLRGEVRNESEAVAFVRKSQLR